MERRSFPLKYRRRRWSGDDKTPSSMDGGALCWGRITGWKKRNHTACVSEEAKTHKICVNFKEAKRSHYLYLCIVYHRTYCDSINKVCKIKKETCGISIEYPSVQDTQTGMFLCNYRVSAFSRAASILGWKNSAPTMSYRPECWNSRMGCALA